MIPTNKRCTLAGRFGSQPTARRWRSLTLATLFAAGLTVALLALLGGTQPARAASFVVTKTEDTADGACDADCSLREAISAANASPGADIITVPAGVYALTIGTLEVTEPTTLNGAGAGMTVIDGNSQWDVLTINGQEATPIVVTLADVTLRHGSGGVAAKYVNLTVNRTEVISSTAGSGIFINSGGLALLSSTVAWNASPYNGGGILASDTDVTVADSAIVSNTAGMSGGGITFWGDKPSSLIILRSIISRNMASSSSYGGGGIYATGDNLTLRDSTITWNTSTGDGGGLRLIDVPALEIAGSTVAYNTAGRGGGGVSFVQSQSLSTTVNITGTQIISNTAGTPDSFEGGGIFVWQDGLITKPLTIALTNSEVLSNTAGWGGGGIFFSGGSTSLSSLTLENSRAAGNTAGNGGGIWFGTHGRLFITTATIANNTALMIGGGIDFEGQGSGKLQIENSIIERNVALTGGGLYGSFGPGSHVAHTIVRANQAIGGTGGFDGIGGGIFGDLDLTAVTLRGNIAAKDGGGIYGGATGGFPRITDSVIADNIADRDGGGLAGAAILLRTTVTGNRAANGGGLALGESEVSQSLIAGNTATEKGGGISVLNAYRGGPTVKIRNSTISGNQAGQSAGISHGGPVYKLCQGPNTIFQYGYGGRMLLDNTTIAANASLTGTGGIRVNVEDRDRDEVEATYCPNGNVNWDTGSDTIETALVNVLVAANDGDNCTALPENASQGHNLSDDGSCLFKAAGDIVKVNAKVGPLQNNGGPTLTHALLDGSPAIDAGGAANCPATDQRGVARPQGPACDIGAFEWQPTTPYLAVAPAALTFVAVAGAQPPPAQPFTVTNTGLGALAWTAAENTPWLSVSPGSGAAPASPSVSVNQAGLPVGEHTASITVAAAGAGGSPQTVAVTLRVIRVQDVIGNWDFEQGRVAWTESSTTLGQLIRPAEQFVAPIAPHAGAWAALLGINNGETSVLSQPLTLPAGISLTLSFHYYAVSVETDCTYDTVQVRLDNTVLDQIGLCQANNTNGWRQRTVELGRFTSPQFPVLRFRVVNDPSSDPSTFALDDVRLGIPPPVYDNFIYLPLTMRAP